MICIKTFANLYEAELAVKTLESHGVDARLSSEDVPGGIPSSFAIGGIRLFVADGDADRAVEILTTPEHTKRAETTGRDPYDGELDDTPVVADQRPPSTRLTVGAVWLVGGLLLTVGTYLIVPGGWFVIASGAIVYGLYEIAVGLRDAWLISERGDDEVSD